MHRQYRLGAAALAIGLLLAACGGGDGDGASGSDAAVTVKLEPTTFKPEDVKIAVGETVRWVWGGGVQHDVKGPDFESGVQTKGNFEHTFDAAGSFEVICTVHPTTMKATIEVS